ncbi:MAG: hypothetical protein JW722_00025 [Demequinaceae bacterium]|nr:hypothetical protein [Demequinaceae bacterium]
MTRRRQPLTFFLLGVALWVVVDWGTAGGFRPSYFASYMPALLVFYLGCPAVFTYLVFRRRVGTRGLIVATLVEIVVVEVIFTGNPWLTSVPLLFVGIPLAIAVYAPLTFFPLWIVRGEMGRHRRLVWALVAVEAAVTFLTVAGAGG